MSKIPFIPNDLSAELNLRARRLHDIMRRDNMNSLLVGGNSNLYYLSGRFFRGYAYVCVDRPTLFFVIRPNGFEETENVVYIRKPEQIADILTQRGFGLPSRPGLEYDELSYSDVVRLAKALHASDSTNGSPLLRKARMVKTPFEIEKMKADGVHQAAAYSRITRLYKADMTDLEFQIEIERVLRLEGGLGYYRTAGNLMENNMGSVVAGKNADSPTPYEFAMGGAGINPALPVGADGTTILTGTTVMVDMNGSFNGYQTDMSRVWALGDIPEIAIKAHNCSRNILHRLEAIGVPGTPCSRLYDEAVEIARAEGLHDYFMGHSQKVAFIGHGVGIELNEQPVLTPRSRDLLAESMTIAIEPKFVIPDVGAVGVENTYVVRESGLESITIFPEEIQEL